MFITPLEGKIIAEPLQKGEKEKTTASGILIANDTVEKMRFVKARVVAVATHKYVGDKLVPMIVKENDVIYFDQTTTREFKYDGNDYFCLEEDRVYGVLNDNS